MAEVHFCTSVYMKVIKLNINERLEYIRKFMTLNENDQEKLNKILDVFIAESQND